MFRKLVHGSPVLLSGFIKLDRSDHDKLSKDVKTVNDFYNRPPELDNETGMDRLKMMYKVDDVNGISTEVNAIYQAGFCGFLAGAVYGGFIYSRNAYENFMNTNQATAFKSNFDAKRKLQDQVTLNFAKGAFKWGWRLGLFTTSYVAIITTISVYRGKSSIIEYITAGAVTGGAYKINLGLRGVLVGGLVGTALGGIAGTASLLLLNVSGTSMEEVRYWQYKWKRQRDSVIKEAERKQAEEDPLLVCHDEQVGKTNLSLKNLEAAKS